MPSLLTRHSAIKWALCPVSKIYGVKESKMASSYKKDFVGGEESGVLSYKGLDMGVEVCADHHQRNYYGGVRNQGQLLEE